MVTWNAVSRQMEKVAMTSTRMTQIAATAIMLLALAGSARAQSCLGLPDLAAMKRNVSVYGSGQGSDRLVLGRYGLSGDRAFGGLQVGYGGYGFDKPKRAAAGGDFGFAIPIGSGKATFCPRLQTVYQLSERRFGWQQQSLTTSLGASLGRSFTPSAKFSVIPFVQGALVNRRDRFNVQDATYGNPSYSQSDYYAMIGAGVGFRIGQSFTIRPALTFPLGGKRNIVGQNESEPTFSLSASFGLRR